MYINIDTAIACRMPIINVYLNGELISHAVEADDEEGYVTILRRDLFEHGDKSIPTQKLNGKVKICIGNEYVK